MSHFHKSCGLVILNTEYRIAFIDEMAAFRRAALISVFLLGVTANIEAGGLRRRLFHGNVGECDSNQFRCHNGNCVDYTQVCNGAYDCSDKTDEGYCEFSSSSSCPSYRSFRCKLRNSYYKCIPDLWMCDGYEDCPQGDDEKNCEKEKVLVSPRFIRKAERLAQKWIHQLRNTEQTLRKWGSDVERIAVALYLSNETTFHESKNIQNEIAYELSVGLLSRLALKKIEDVSSTELASYINAFLVTCIDPRKFYVLDLVDELSKRVDAQNYTNPYVMLALCNAGERITPNDVEKLIKVFWKAHREFWTDTQALAVLALVCAAGQPYEAYDLEDISELTTELKRRQYRNGTVENLKTTALVMQALFASEMEADEDNFDEEKALKQILNSQHEDGSFGNLINTYYVLPVLRQKSLVNISSSHCRIPLVDEEEALVDLMNQVGVKWSVKFSLWIGNNRTVERTITLNVPANISFYRLMEFAAGVDNKYRFEYSMRNGKPYIYSISGMQDDPERGMFWFLFKVEPGNEEELTLITKSPVDILPTNKQHIIFWYKCGPWTK